MTSQNFLIYEFLDPICFPYHAIDAILNHICDVFHNCQVFDRRVCIPVNSLKFM